MKMQLLCFFYLVSAVVGLSATTDQYLFVRAGQFLRAADYTQALDTYKKITSKTPAVWYNMGYCAYQLAAYEHAWGYCMCAQQGATDHEQEIAYAIDVINKQLSVPEQSTRMRDWLSRIPGNSVLLLLQIIMVLSWFMLFFVWHIYKRTQRYGILMLLLLINIVCAVLIAKIYYNTTQQQVFVVDALAVQAGPHENYPTIAQLKKVSIATVCDKKNNWYKVKQDSTIGWVVGEKLIVR